MKKPHFLTQILSEVVSDDIKRPLLFLLVFLTCGVANATSYEKTGVVQFLRSHDSTYGADLDWVAIQGVSSAGSCGVADGFVVFRIKDDARGARHFSLLAAAKVAGNSVTIIVDDAIKDLGGYCYIRNMIF